MLFDYIKNQIDSHLVISFDIFDTLLLRPYAKPTDLFLHLEKIHQTAGFKDARIQAEKQARQINADAEDITLDDIYAQLDKKYKHCQNLELQLERQILYPNPDLKEIFDYAKKQKKRIIITSDMYLPEDFLSDVLAQKGFAEFDKIYLSSSIRKTKDTGTLYQHILDDLKVKPADILHMGDNLKSDKIKAEKAGLHSIFFPKKIDEVFENNQRAKIFYERHQNDLTASVLLGLLAISPADDNYWKNFGYTYAGPAILAYVNWIYRQLTHDKINDVMFLGRDGYPLKKVFNLLYPDKFNTHYFYAPRLLNLATQKKSYTTYLKQFDLKSKNIALIDSCSSLLSAQKKLVACLPNKNITGYYWFTYDNGRNNTEKYQIKTFQYSDKTKFLNWNIMELFMSAPTPPVEKINGTDVVFKKANAFDKKRIEIYPNLLDGITFFAEKYQEIFKSASVQFSCDTIVDWINILCTVSTKKDKEQFSQIYHAEDKGHTDYKPLMACWNKHQINMKGFFKVISNNDKFEIKLFKFISFIKYKRSSNRFYFLGLPVCQTKKKKNKTVFLLFNFLPLISIKRT